MHSLTRRETLIETDGIILDVDGTIWDSTEVVAVAWNDAAAVLRMDVPRVDGATLRREFGKKMNDIANDLWPNLSDEDKLRLMNRCCLHEQKELSLLDTPGHPNVKDIVYPGVVETVQKMSDYVPFFIVSNCQTGYIERMMKMTGLTEYILGYECCGTMGYGKADNIKILVKSYRMRHPIYVGDTSFDATACRLAGVPFVWASYGFGHDVEADYKIESFAEIEKLVLSWATTVIRRIGV